MSDTQLAWHTVVTHDENGIVHIQRRGPDHVVEGSERIIDLLPGEVAVIRHMVD